MENLPGEKSQTKYAAFLRGINVGGKTLVKMDDLRKAFESLGFKNVETVLASGNVVFEAPKETTTTLSEMIMQKLRDTFGRDILVIVRSIEDLRELEAQQPFKDTVVTPQTRLIVMLLSENTLQPDISDLPVSEYFKIIGVYNRTICSVIGEEQGTVTVQLMSALEKKFGKQVTTRTWGTIVRILKNSSVE